MSKCIIVGASKSSYREINYNQDDFIIASDKGYEYLIHNNIKIDLLVGDFDSLGYKPEFNNIVKLNVIKDITDTHQAIEEAIKRGYTTIDIYGCLEGRIEHSVAMISDAFYYTEKGYNITLYSSNQTIKFINNGSININKESGFISIFSLTEKSTGVTIKNLKYELSNETLYSNYPLGVSNEFIKKEATIEVASGCLMIIY